MEKTVKIKAAFCLVLLLAGVTVLSAQQALPCGGKTSTASINWSQLGFGPCHTFFNPNEITIGPSNVADLVLAWKYSAGSGIVAPAVGNGVVYFGSNNGTVYAVSSQTGTLLWSFATEVQMQTSAPAVAYGFVYVASYYGELYALNASTGTVVWMARAHGAPTVSNGVVYAAVNGISALDAHTGAVLWNYSAGGAASPAAVVDGTVFAATADGNVHALDAITGAPKWQQTAAPSSGLGVADGVVYFSVDPVNPQVMGLDAGTGAVRWGTGFFDSLQGALVDANGLMYLGVQEYRQNANVIWILNDNNGYYQTIFQLNNDMVYPLLVANGVLYMGTAYNEHRLYAVGTHSENGSWEYDLGTQPISAALVNGMLFVGGLDGNLYAFHLPSQQ